MFQPFTSKNQIFRNIAHDRSISKFDPNCICVFVFVYFDVRHLGTLFLYIFQIDSYNKSTSHIFGAIPWSTVACYIAVIAQLFRFSTHPKAAELCVAALAPLDRHLRRLARADVALLPAGVQHGGGKGARCTAAWLLP